MSAGRLLRLVAAPWLILAVFSSAARAQEPAQLVVHLLDYVAVDYGGAVEHGAVKSPDEYKEMLEFTAQVKEGIESLPASAKRNALTAQAMELSRLVSAKAEPDLVAGRASDLRGKVIDVYGLQVSPEVLPDLSAAAGIYARNCESCHGMHGRGDGPTAHSLDPPPADFHSGERMANRSVYGLYNSISLGVAGTAMAGFPQLTEEQRWALAFHVSNLGTATERVEKGQNVWRSREGDSPSHTLFSGFKPLATLSRNEVLSRYGEDAALAQDFLRAHPEALEKSGSDPIAIARKRLAASMAAYDRDERAAAMRLAVSAYLDGFELAETALDAVDHDMRLEIEHEMMSLRAAVKDDMPKDAVRDHIRRVDVLLQRAGESLSGAGLSQASAFFSACIILLREGLEAILLLAAIIAFVAKTGRRDVMPWIHSGWLAAIVLGALTWTAAEYLIDVSGASREITEGITALLATGTLLYVGFWLHGKSQSKAWLQFLYQQVGAALEKRTLWAMASVSFLAVYRELFEIILFYQALWSQSGHGSHGAVLGGAGASILVLAVAGRAIFKYSVRLPLGPFFLAMLWLVLLFAFIFAGDGIAKLQEAGAVSASPIHFLAIPILGIHPTMETIGAQFAVVVLVAASFWAARRKGFG